jgi:hypothetical protein
VDTSPAFPRALDFSDVRDLTYTSFDVKDAWKMRLMNPAVLCETPWENLRTDQDRFVNSAIFDLQIFSFKTFIFAIATSMIAN